jgi:uncharacterized membrane protein YtjA (UPF0391 family)
MPTLRSFFPGKGIIQTHYNAFTKYGIDFSRLVAEIINALKINFMLRWSFAFLVIAIVAAIFGFTNIAAGAAEIAKILFFIFISIWLIVLILGLTIFKG